MLQTFFLVVTSILQIQSLEFGESCFANDEPGTCIALSECKPVLSYIEKFGNQIPNNLLQKFQDLTCGYDHSDPLVCCTTSQHITGYFNNFGNQNGGTSVPKRPKPVPTSNSGNWGGQPSKEQTTSNRPTTADTDINKSGRDDDFPDIRQNPNLSLLSSNCGTIESDRIFGGNRTRLFEMPWMVLLSYDSDRGTKLNCGGTLINEWYVLTAAHCVSFLGNRLTLKHVILGEYDTRQDPDCERSEGKEYCAAGIITAEFDEVIPHTGYTPQTLIDDIALIRLKEPADFDLDNIKAICLPITPELQREPLVDNFGVVAGWGVTEEGLQSPVLLSVQLPILSKEKCLQDYSQYSLKINDKQLCAGGLHDKDSCAGDSGGPLLYPGKVGSTGVRYVQRGIVSFGSKRCGISLPGVYTNVAYYMDWILNNIRS